MQTTIQDLLATGDPIITDGAMGTMLFASGLERGSSPELWNVEHPDRIRAVHRGYIEAGAQIVVTNTFGGSPVRLGSHGLQDRAAELNRAAAELARAEADAAPHGVLVGGDIGPSGEVLKPYGPLDVDEASAGFETQIRALIEGGADLIWIETMFDLAEIRAVAEALRRVDPVFPFVATLTFDTKGHTMMGVTPQKAVDTLLAYGPVALGANCGNGPDEIKAVIEKMRAANADIPLIARANAGLPTLDDDDNLVYAGTPEVMADYAATVRGLGANIIGACCGSTPDHIRAISLRLRQ